MIVDDGWLVHRCTIVESGVRTDLEAGAGANGGGALGSFGFDRDRRSGWRSLTPREQRVVQFAASGMTNAEIAQCMFVSVNTVKTHLKHVFTKLGVTTRAELAANAARRRRATEDA